eukprot:EG_transcript_15989
MLPIYLPAFLLAILSFPISLASRGASKPPGPELALYFVGPPRTLNTTLCSLLDNVVHPLLAQRCRLTFFVYTPNVSGVEQYDLLQAVPGVQVVMRVINDPPSPSASCTDRLKASGRLHHYLHPHYNEELLAHIRDMEAVDRERLAFEAAQHVRFDRVVFLRPDVTYVSPLPRLGSLSPARIYVPSWLMWGGINDRFAVVPRQYTEPYFHLYTALCEKGAVQQLPRMARMNPEWIYQWHLNRSRVPLGLVAHFFFIRTRAYFTPFENLMPCDLSVVSGMQCRLAFQYRCCSAAVGPPRRLHLRRSNCTRVVALAANVCKRIARWRIGHLNSNSKTPCMSERDFGRSPFVPTSAL